MRLIDSWHKFHVAHPRAYMLFVKHMLRLLERDADRLVESWYVAKYVNNEELSYQSPDAISNDHIALYGRKFVMEYPHYYDRVPLEDMTRVTKQELIDHGLASYGGVDKENA